jgi:putative oxidoreductase
MDERRNDVMNSIGLLILRVGVGGFMLTHGWGKVQMLTNGAFDQFGDPIGLGNKASLILATGAEFVCPLLVILGLATRFAAVPVVFTMGVAAFVAHGSDPWTMGTAAQRFMSGAAKSWASKEPALLFLIPFLALAFTGAGRFSVDALIRAKRSGRRRGGDR